MSHARIADAGAPSALSAGFLLDTNVMAALSFEDHEAHVPCLKWFVGIGSFALCPLVELGYARLVMRPEKSGGYGFNARLMLQLLDGFRSDPRCQLLDDRAEALGAVGWQRVLGHNQVNDAYLLALAMQHQLRLATLDRGLLSLCAPDQQASIHLIH